MKKKFLKLSKLPGVICFPKSISDILNFSNMPTHPSKYSYLLLLMLPTMKNT